MKIVRPELAKRTIYTLDIHARITLYGNVIHLVLIVSNMLATEIEKRKVGEFFYKNNNNNNNNVIDSSFYIQFYGYGNSRVQLVEI